MGNCQAAADAAAVVIQHPGGKAERRHCPTSAAEVMRSNPGHRVALVTLCAAPAVERRDGGRVTRVRLLGPKDVLLLGHAYRLVTSQEIAEAHEKLKKRRAELIREGTGKDSDHARKQEKGGQRSMTEVVTVRGRHWRPSLQIISEMSS